MSGKSKNVEVASRVYLPLPELSRKIERDCACRVGRNILLSRLNCGETVISLLRIRISSVNSIKSISYIHTLYLQVKTSYSACPENISGNTFIHPFIRDVDMLKRKLPVLEEAESFVVEA